MIKAGIMGATGYAGMELARILLLHPNVEVSYYGSKSYEGMPYTKVVPSMQKMIDKKCEDISMEDLSKKVDVIFTATPQGLCADLMTDEVLNNAKVIDLSADYRIKDVEIYEKWYGIKHKSPKFIDEAVYGLCEINREKIKNVRIVANPGCFPTCSILTIYPLLKEGLIDPESIIIDAKSGTTGAGRGAKVQNLFCEVNENCKAYSVGAHRHTPEIEEQLGYAAGKNLTISFTPHLIPMQRGILVTAYASLITGVSEKEIKNAYDKYYEKEYFIRMLESGILPQTSSVRGSNFVDINFHVDSRTGRVVMMGAIDNLVKGAAGQAVQNMNILFGFPENMGIDMMPVCP